MSLRVRLAPSPTGFLHIGTLGMAIVNRMIANTNKGVFYLRIEDTDQKREIEGATEQLINDLALFGIKFDEGPYVQSQRKEIYQKYVQELIEKNLAYKDFNEDRTYCVRLRATSKFDVTWKDLVKGDMKLPSLERDPVILKSNGIPPYNLAHVVDDHLMKTTIITRGEEWLPSTAEHIQLASAVWGEGKAPWKYAHMPVICIVDNGNKRKLSKRKDASALASHYLSNGYPTEAVIEYLLTIYNSKFEPWRRENPGKAYTEFKFSMEDIGSNNPLFDIAKLNHISKEIISKKTCAQINKEIDKYFKTYSPETSKEVIAKIKQILKIDRETEKPRKDIACYADIKTEYDFLFARPNVEKSDLAKAFTKTFNNSDTKEVWLEKIKSLNDKSAMKEIRKTLTGKDTGPDLYQIMQILGAEEVMARLL